MSIERPGLEQIDGSGAADGQVPVWDAATGVWKPGAAGSVPATRTIGTDATLTGGGDLSADRTLGVDTTAEAERIRDVIGAALVQGANITITVNDAGDTITIAVTGGGAVVPLTTLDSSGNLVFVTTDDGSLVTVEV